MKSIFARLKQKIVSPFRTRFVPRETIMRLNYVYPSRRTVIKSRASPVALYQGVAFRGDKGFDGNGMDYFFENGFMQRPVALDFDVMNGMLMAGHTDSQGISTSSDFTFAAAWHAKHVYILDLFEHPFAIDINRVGLAFHFPMDKSQSEINVANRIDRSMVVGHYDDELQQLTLNPHYEGIIRVR